MIIIVALIVMVAAVVIGVAGVLGNGGSGHALAHGAGPLPGMAPLGPSPMSPPVCRPRSTIHEWQQPMSVSWKIAHRTEALKGAALHGIGRVPGSRRLHGPAGGLRCCG
jgi:hypothetical protein